MKFHHKLEIPQLKEIQDELYAYVKDLLESNSKKFIGKPVKSDELINFPVLLDYLKSISKVPLHKMQPLKFFISAPDVHGSIHMDFDTTSRIALNIPVSGCKNTFLVYYETDADNIVQENPDPSVAQGYSYVPRDYSRLKLVDRIEFTEPCLMRTDQLHQSVNSGNEYRVIVTVRWEANRHLTEFEDFVKI